VSKTLTNRKIHQSLAFFFFFFRFSYPMINGKNTRVAKLLVLPVCRSKKSRAFSKLDCCTCDETIKARVMLIM